MNESMDGKLKSTVQARLFFFCAWCLPVLWALWVYGHYFAHLRSALGAGPALFSASRWLDPGFADRVKVWAGSLWILLCSAAIVGTTLAWGARLRRWLGLEIQDDWIRWALQFGLGVLGLDFFWLGSGLLGLWREPFLAVVLTALGLVTLWDAWRCRQGISFCRTDFIPDGAAFRFLWGFALFYLLLAVGHDLVPETFYDSMVYHLAVPANWLMRHGVTDDPANFFSNYPYGAEFYFLNGLFLQGTEAAKFLHVAAFFFCALLAGGWARQIAGPQAGWLAAGMVFTLPLLVLNVATTQVEGMLALFILLFLYALWRVFEEPTLDSRWAWTCGLLAGTALSVKYTAAVGLLSGTLALGRVVFQKSKRSSWVWIEMGGLLVLGVWLLKNFCFTGDPFFPYAGHWFGGRVLPTAGYTRLLTEQRAFNGGGFWGWVRLPWTLVVSNPDSYNFVGPLALGLVPFLFFGGLKNRTARFWAWSAGLYFAGGLFITHILRFMVPAFVIFYMVAAVVFAGRGKGWARGLAWASGLTAFLCFFYFAEISDFYYGCAGVWSGKETRFDYLQDRGKITPYAQMAQWISKNLPRDARLLIVGDARGLYYKRPFWANTVFDDQLLARAAEEQKDPEGIRRELLRWGITDLVVNGWEGVRVSGEYHHYDLSPAAWARLDSFFKTQTTVVYDRNFQSVYALQPAAPGQVNSDPVPVLFFTVPGKRFIEDYERQNWTAVEADLTQALALYPGCVFFREEQAETEAKLGRNANAEKLFEKASGQGDLTPEGYQDWARVAKTLELRSQVHRILRRAHAIYPEKFPAS
ncbi:MAG: hypothetical protein ACREL1_09430 [bacterium]